jgi:hypothetical protein
MISLQHANLFINAILTNDCLPSIHQSIHACL